MSISSAPSIIACRTWLRTAITSSSPVGKLTTVATRIPEPASAARHWATKSGQTQTAATGPCGVRARSQSAAIAAASQPSSRFVRSRQASARAAAARRSVMAPSPASRAPCAPAANAPGSSAPTVVRASSPPSPARITGASGGANSASFCRQPPQGVTGVGLSATTTTSAISVRPAATIAAIAPASAQVPSG